MIKEAYIEEVVNKTNPSVIAGSNLNIQASDIASELEQLRREVKNEKAKIFEIDQLAATKIELAYHLKEKEKRAAELVIANKELSFQNTEKAKRVDELIIANEEKEKRAAELVVANEELRYQNQEKEDRAAELAVANKELAYQNNEKEKRAAELALSNNRLHIALIDIVQIITKLGEMRDPYTSGHERRVGEIAAAISQELGFDPQYQEKMRLAGYMHDVGKTSIPTEILSKPGKLIEQEYALIQTHAQVGHDILKGVHFDPSIALIALQHHERVDGSGYPNKLKGNEILMEARILAVADVIEAMSSHRPYRAALGVDVALKEVTSHRGTYFDSVVVDAMVRLVEQKGYRIPV